MSHYSRVVAMMKAYGQDCPTYPDVPAEDVVKLRAALLLEEVFEFVEASGLRVRVDDRYVSYKDISLQRGGEVSLVDVVDGLADISVVMTGGFVAYGLQAEPVLQIVDANNMAKVAKGSRGPDGKWIKPADHKPPDIAGEIERQRLVSRVVAAVANTTPTTPPPRPASRPLLQIRPKNQEVVFYSPQRDLAYIFVLALREAAIGTLAAWPDYLAELLPNVKTRQGEITAALERFVAALREFRNPEVETAHAALVRAGWYDVPGPVRCALYARLGEVFTGGYFVAAREVDPACCDNVVRTMEELLQQSVAADVAATTPYWRRVLQKAITWTSRMWRRK